jgi:hypothetical protein
MVVDHAVDVRCDPALVALVQALERDIVTPSDGGDEGFV